LAVLDGKEPEFAPFVLFDGGRTGPGGRANTIRALMGPVTATMPIDVPRERAFAFLADLANRPAFMGRFLEEFRLQRLESEGMGAAARFRVRERGLWMESVIAELEPPYRIVERGRGSRLGRMPIDTAWELTETGPSSCEVKVIHWTEPSHPLDRIAELAPGMERYYRRALEGALSQLKTLLEGDVVPERVAVAGGDRVPGAG
jgi:uncharacterized protein YndB with AHSA1/START domain